MPNTRLHTGFNIEVEFTLSAFHKRLFAWLLDGLFMWLYIWILNTMFSKAPMALQIVVYLPLLMYHLLFELFTKGQSPGKKIMRIQVIAVTGGKPSMSQFLIRWMFRAVDFPVWILPALMYGEWPWYMFVFMFTGLVCFVSTPLSQRVGDLLADTMVIDTKNEGAWQNTVFTEVDDTYQPVYPQVMNLSDRDMNTIKQVLIHGQKQHSSEITFKVAQKIQMALRIETNEEPIDFLATLLKDYNYLSRR